MKVLKTKNKDIVKFEDKSDLRDYLYSVYGDFELCTPYIRSCLIINQDKISGNYVIRQVCKGFPVSPDDELIVYLSNRN